MNRNYIVHIAETKVQYHKLRAKLPYEEKLKIIIELQKIDIEMRKKSNKKTDDNKFRMVWRPTGFMNDDK